MANEDVAKLPDYQPMSKVLETTDRLTFHFSAVHQHHGSPAVTVEGRFAYLLDNVEQPYVRRLPIGPDEWMKFDQGWIQKPGMVVIENLVGRVNLVNLSDEQKAAQAQQILLLSMDGVTTHFIVRPGRVFIAEMQDAVGMYLRGAFGTVQAAINVMPR